MYTGPWLKNTPNNVSHGSVRPHPVLVEQCPDIAELRRMQWILRDEQNLQRYVDAVAAAVPEQINLARPQLFQAVEMIRETMFTRTHNHDFRLDKKDLPGLLDGDATVSAVVGRIIDGAVREGQRHAKTALKEPGNEEALQGLAAAVRVLAEARTVLTKVGAETGAGWAYDGYLKADTGLGQLMPEVLRLRRGVGFLYRKAVEAHLPTVDTLDSQAIESAAQDLGRYTDALTPRQLQAICDMTGDWEPGRRARLGRPNDPDHWLEHERPLSTERAEDLRGRVVAVLATYQAVFHEPGFVSLLQQASVMSRFEAMQTVDRETVANVEHKAADVVARHKEEAEHGSWRFHAYHAQKARRPVEDHQAEIAGRQRSYLDEARRRLALADEIDGFLVQAARALRVEPPVLSLVMEQQDGLVVLRPTQGGKVVVGYPDGDDAHCFADRVYMAALPQELAAAGIPSLDEVRAMPGIVGTNFRNIEDMLASLQDPQIQEFVFGRPAVVVNAAEFAPVRPQCDNDEEEDLDPVPY